MNRTRIFVVVCLVAIAVALFFVIRSQDDSSSPSTEDHREASQDWIAAGEDARYVVCEMWATSESSVEELLVDTNVDQGLIDAKLMLIESECES